MCPFREFGMLENVKSAEKLRRFVMFANLIIDGCIRRSTK
jgi:hypothetical protein